MMNEPQVSFITVCYNGFKDTCELIESLQTHVHSVSYEIIVVDNASREDEATKIKELYSDIVTLRSESNLGFSGGNNLGIRVAKGAYIFLINNDTYVESDGFHYLTERLESQNLISRSTFKHKVIGGFTGHLDTDSTFTTIYFIFNPPDRSRHGRKWSIRFFRIFRIYSLLFILIRTR